jgi:hypothetical protein
MKLSLKIPLAFAAALLRIFAGALYGIFALNQSINAYGTTVQENVANERMVSATHVAFKPQVREWKDTLLRGKNPAQLDKYWTALQTREKTVDSLAAELRTKLPEGESRTLIERFAAAHGSMGEGYRKGFEAFQRAGRRKSRNRRTPCERNQRRALAGRARARDDWWLPIQPHGVAPAWTGPRLRACGRDR